MWTLERRFTNMKVWVNGTFDVIHPAHIKLIEFASTFGNVRIGIDSDERVRLLKGNNRPYFKWDDRAYQIKSLKYVDSVVEFTTDEELRNEIKNWNPDIMVIGSDYKNKYIVGSDLVSEIIFFKRIDGYSTTNILNND